MYVTSDAKYPLYGCRSRERCVAPAVDPCHRRILQNAGWIRRWVGKKGVEFTRFRRRFVRRQLKKEVLFLRLDVAGTPMSDSWVSESPMSKEIVMKILSLNEHMYGQLITLIFFNYVPDWVTGVLLIPNPLRSTWRSISVLSSSRASSFSSGGSQVNLKLGWIKAASRKARSVKRSPKRFCIEDRIELISG